MLMDYVLFWSVNKAIASGLAKVAVFGDCFANSS